MRGVLILALVIGLGSFSAVVAWVGAGDILKAVAAAGAGVFVVAGFHLLPLSLDALSWRALCRGEHLSALQAVRFRWIGQSVNGLLPAAQVGGDLLRIRLAKAAGMSGDLAAAGVVADLTLAVATQIVYSLMGLAALAFLGLDLGDGHGTALAGSLALLALGVAGFIAVQNSGLLARLAGLAESLLGSDKGWAESAKAMERRLGDIYRDRPALARALAWRMAGWLAGTGEVWLGLWFLGHPVSLAEAFMIEALIQAVRSAAFLVPGALGIQEIALVVLGASAGIGADVAVALSLLKRARELLVGLPGLAVWQIWEIKRLSVRSGHSD